MMTSGWEPSHRTETEGAVEPWGRPSTQTVSKPETIWGLGRQLGEALPVNWGGAQQEDIASLHSWRCSLPGLGRVGQ